MRLLTLRPASSWWSNGKGDDTRILDDAPIDEAAFYRTGHLFDLYHNGVSMKFRVTETVERDGRRITYGVRISDA